MNEKLTLLPLTTAAPFKSCRVPQRIRLLFIALALFWASGSTLLRASEIHQAAREGDLPKVLLLLRGNPDLVYDLTADDRSTPLHEAVRGGHIEIVRALIAAKSEVNAKTSYGYSPLKMAKIYRRTEIASLLEANGGLMLELPSKARTAWVVPMAQAPQRASMPRYRSAIRGDKELRVINNSQRTVSVRILSGDAGADLYIAPRSSRSAYVPTGNFELYYIFSDEPWTLYKGDNVWLSSNIASGSITIGASIGNYSIRKVN